MLLDLIRQSTPNFLTSIKIIKSESNSMSTEIERLESASFTTAIETAYQNHHHPASTRFHPDDQFG
jgi:hypothetical protein